MANGEQHERPPWQDRDAFKAILESVDWNLTEAMVQMQCGRTTATTWFRRHGLAAERPYSTDQLKARAGSASSGVSSRPALSVQAIDPADLERADVIVLRSEEAKLAAKRASEVERYRAQVKALRAENRELAKHGDVIGTIRDLLAPTIAGLQLPEVKNPPMAKRTGRAPVSVVVHMCDWHWGELVDPDIVDGHNAYSPGIAARRAQHLIDVLLTWVDHYDELHGVEEVVVVVNGDMASGQHILHPSSATEYARIAVQVVDVALVAAQCIRDIATRVKRVRVVTTRRGGNHGRSERKMPTGVAAAQTSWEALLVEYLAALLKDVRNVRWQIGSGYKFKFDVQGVPFAAAHGDMLKGGGGQLGIPAYAIKRLFDATQKRSAQAARRDVELGELAALSRIVRHLRIGHFHTLVMWGIDDGDVGMCPSLKGVDAFVMDALERYSPAAQLVEVVHPRRGIVGTHPVRVQHVMDEAGACRYAWGAMQGDAPAWELLEQ